MRYLILLVALFACAPTETTSTPREHLRGLISGYEQGPERARLDVAPGDVVEGLLALARDTSEKRFYRARAITALGLYSEDERAYQFISFVVEQPDSGLLERSSAIRALSKGFSETHPEEVARLLSPLLQSTSPLLQQAATEALSTEPIKKMKQTQKPNRY